MNAIKLMLAYVPPPAASVTASMVIHVDKMSRLFVSNGEKSFSTSFPFSVYVNDEGVEFSSPACPLIDSKVTSEILNLVNGNEIFSSRNVMAFADPIMEMADDEDTIWGLFLELMLSDDGYVRVDHDPVNENGNLHPLNHADVFYSQFSTFKIGLRKQPTLDEFHDILNIRSSCHFLGAV